MRNFCFILAVLCTLCAMAQPHITVTSGNAIPLENPNGIDIVYLFENLNDATIETTDSNPVWFRLEDGVTTEIARGINYLYPEDNTGYILQTYEGQISFWVLDYSQYKMGVHSIEVDEEYDNLCEETPLLLEAHIPEMSYQNTHGAKQTINRTCKVTYHSLTWGGEEWVDSLCVEEPRLKNTVIVGAPLQNTTFTLYDNQFAEKLGISADSISTRMFEAVAVDAHPITITTTRGTGDPLDLSNEVGRPIEETQLSGSAPLDIFFKANGTPAVKYYQWQLLKGNDMIAQRTDMEHRYNFDVQGEYRALLWVSNDYCKTDSTEIKISVAISQLKVPNVFTPNGDGKNDEFRVMYRSIIDFHCYVYNRWGKKVYEWHDPAKGWDGTINGRPAAESAYFYVIRAVGADGQEYELKGDINLIRGKK